MIMVDPEKEPAGKPAEKSNFQDAISTWTTLPNVIALAVIIGYVYFVIHMFGMTEVKDETVWTRATFLLTGYEAIAFAAAGYIFGKEVHRKQAEKAEEKADEAMDEAAKAKEGENDALSKGYRLAEAVKARASALAPTEEELVAKGFSSAGGGSDYLANLAEKLFP